jgi:hypothetical protein
MADTIDFPPSRKSDVQSAVEAVLTPGVFVPWSRFISLLTRARPALANLRENRAAEYAAWMKARKEGREVMLDTSSPEEVEAFNEALRRQNAEGAEAHLISQREAGDIAVEALGYGFIEIYPPIAGEALGVRGRGGYFDIITAAGVMNEKKKEHVVRLAVARAEPTGAKLVTYATDDGDEDGNRHSVHLAPTGPPPAPQPPTASSQTSSAPSCAPLMSDAPVRLTPDPPLARLVASERSAVEASPPPEVLRETSAPATSPAQRGDRPQQTRRRPEREKAEKALLRRYPDGLLPDEEPNFFIRVVDQECKEMGLREPDWPKRDSVSRAVKQIRARSALRAAQSACRQS